MVSSGNMMMSYSMKNSRRSSIFYEIQSPCIHVRCRGQPGNTGIRAHWKAADSALCDAYEQDNTESTDEYWK
ncbi:hypothetical protein D5274_06395 [bacterium 1XD42-94]|nr:hypothetical protein [bacterium 1XD42-76]NBK04801.1 hypothetical protein [bacterium 1XD42-94]